MSDTNDNAAFEKEENAKADEQNVEVATQNDEQKDGSRFSEDGMETEIEVSSEELDKTEKKKKKKKKRNTSSSSADNAESPVDEKKENLASSESDDVEVTCTDSNEKPVKRTWMSKIKHVKTTPLFALLALKVCVILPISIYACDVIIGLNVLSDQTEMMKEHISEKYSNVSYEPFIMLQYRHNHTGTLLKHIEKAAESHHMLVTKKHNSKTPEKQPEEKVVLSSVTSQTPSYIVNTGNTTSEFINTTTVHITNQQLNITSNVTVVISNTTLMQEKTTFDTTVISNETSSVTTTSTFDLTSTPATSDSSSVGYQTTDIDQFTSEPHDQTTYFIERDQSNQYCYDNVFFVKLHQEYSAKYQLDWHSSVVADLQKNQQALFFMFTVLGVLFIISSIVMRCDIFLNQKWSSYLITTFLLYAISTSLTAHAFFLQTSKGGLRCFLCRFRAGCEDIDPWNLKTTGDFLTEVNWTLVAFLSILFKAYDCLVIGCVTLWFVLDVKADPAWFTFLKVFGWIVIFPLMTFTPFFGVLAFEVLPGCGFVQTTETLAMTILFGIGCAFWGVGLIVLPIFCKLRMCVENTEDENSEEDLY